MNASKFYIVEHKHLGRTYYTIEKEYNTSSSNVYVLLENGEFVIMRLAPKKK